jgi:hypothetical protein
VSSRSPRPSRRPRLLDFARTCQRHFAAARVLFRVAAEVRDALSAPKPMAKAPPFAAVSAYVRDVEKMAHLCHGSGIAFLAVLQPMLGLSGKEGTPRGRGRSGTRRLIVCVIDGQDPSGRPRAQVW